MPLGRGLGALIPPKIIKKITEENLSETGEKILQISPQEIEPNPHQPRKIFSHSDLEELISSIKIYGIIQPLIVSKIGENKYQLIAGERRWRSAKILEMKTVPAIVRQVKDIEKLEISLLENIQRKDLNPMEKARAYQRLISEFNLTQKEIADRLGKARVSITNTLRLLELPDIIQQAIDEERITEGHAKALLSVKTLEKQKVLLRRIIGLGLTVRETERAASGNKNHYSAKLESALLAKEEELEKKFGTKVRIKRKKRGGKVIIEAYNQEDLDKLIDKLLNL